MSSETSGKSIKYTSKKIELNILKKLESLGINIYDEIYKKRFPSIELPSRSTTNIVYDPKIRQYVLGDKRIQRSARNIRHLRPFAQFLWLATFAKDLILTDKTSTLRDAFYNALGFGIDFKDQAESDDTIMDLEAFLNSSRENFHIFPEERSSVFGPLIVEFTTKGYEGRRLDLTSIPDGAMIGPSMAKAEFIKCKAKMVLVVEKGAVYQRFLEEKAHEKFKAILIHTAGQAPRATRHFIRRLNHELNLPIYIFTDADVFGMHIASVLIYGSALAAHITELNIPDAIWAGIYASDIERYKLPAMKLSSIDVKRLKELEKDPRYQKDPWKREINVFWKHQKKAELEAFSRYGLPFIVNEFLPERLAEIERR
ncbi:MAG: DNA topoisomerase IV subunit A [Nitrososphaerota archaeon]